MTLGIFIILELATMNALKTVPVDTSDLNEPAVRVPTSNITLNYQNLIHVSVPLHQASEDPPGKENG